MSIINDALKKTQQCLKRSKPKKNPEESKAIESNQEKPKIIEQNQEKPAEQNPTKPMAQSPEQPKPAQPTPKASEGMTNVYEKMYRERQQKEALSTEPSKTKDASKPSEQSSTLRRAKNWFKASLAVVFCMSAVFMSYSYISKNASVQKFFSSKRTSTKSSRYLIAKHVPKKRKYKPDDLVLNGITFIDGKRVALINDEIYETGAIVNSKTITNITPTEVELRDDEKIFTITIH